MICHPCRNRQHQSCPGGTSCCCQHRTDRRPAPRGASAEPAPLVDRLGDTWVSPVTVTGFDTEEDR